MLKQCLTLLKHAMMLKQCLTLLKHSKTVVNTVWLKSEAIQPFFCNHMKCLQNSPKCNSNLWHPCELISLSNALWAVSKSSRALWADLSLSNALWARVQEPCEPISLSLEHILSYEQEPCEPSLSHVSFELRDWLTRSLLGSPRRGNVATLFATLIS